MLRFDNLRLRWRTLLALSVFFSLLFYSCTFDTGKAERDIRMPIVPVESEQWIEYVATIAPAAPSPVPSNVSDLPKTSPPAPGTFPRPIYTPSTVDVQMVNISQGLVVAAKISEDTSWTSSLPPTINSTIYILDSPTAQHTIPKNKGHEAMAYLTHIIAHYSSLPSITIFMHTRPTTRLENKNNLLSAAETAQQLNPAKVLRDGYVNLRCHLDPGCSAPMHPLTDSQNPRHPDAVIFAKAWTELLPGHAVPESVAQPCCAQFAVSRERIHALPRAQYIHFRDWLLDVDLSDELSGKVFEYLWQYIWTGQAVVCPAENVCYCDGYGICFGGPQEYAGYFAVREQAREIHAQIDSVDGTSLEDEDRHYWEFLRLRLGRLERQIGGTLEAALERGADPRMRAKEAGRAWSEGDGF